MDNNDFLVIEVSDGNIYSLHEAQKTIQHKIQPWAYNMLDLIEAGETSLSSLSLLKEAILKWNGVPLPVVDSEKLEWHPPVRKPSKICCLALNNSANADRIISGPKHPAVFIKASNALVGHGSYIEIKPHFGRVHPEPELAIVIGKTAKNVSPKRSLEHIFGYTIHNDITSPTMRGEDTFHYRAIHPKNDGTNEIQYLDTHVSYPGRYKGSDTFSPMGPWIVMQADIENPHDLGIRCDHKGELVTEDNTQNLTHKIADVLAFISGYITLLPGDIISMGTALKSVGIKGKAIQNVDLHKLGGPVSVSIENIGTLISNVRVVD